jgi:hypothetical protein
MQDAHPTPTVIKTLQGMTRCRERSLGMLASLCLHVVSDCCVPAAEAGPVSFIDSGDNHSIAIVKGVAYTWGESALFVC